MQNLFRFCLFSHCLFLLQDLTLQLPVFLISSSLQYFLRLSCPYLLWRTLGYLWNGPQFGYNVFSWFLKKFCIFERIAQRWCFWGYPIKRYIMLICIVGGIDFDHLSKVVNCRIRPLKFTIFPFIISKYFKIENLRLRIYPVLASTFTCSFSFPPWILPMAIPMVNLYFSHSLYIN